MDIATPPVDLLSANPAQPRFGRSASRAAMAEAAKEFEAVFMAQMLKPMWAGLETDPVFGGGPGEDVMRDMMVQEYGKSLVGLDGGALSKAVMDVMIRLQEDGAARGTKGGM